MTADQARTAIKSLGEFVSASEIKDDERTLIFVKYDPGARSGKFHTYKHLTVPVTVYEEIKHELK